MSTENHLSRRNFIFASTLFALPTLFIRKLRPLVSILNDGCTIKIPAASMKDRTRFIKDDFVRYLQTGKDYPFTKIFHLGGVFPSDDTKGKQLFQREKYLRINKTADASFLTNKGVRSLDVPFKAQLEGQNLNLIVNFPVTINLKTAYDASNLTIEAITPLLLTLSDMPNLACETLFPSQHLLKGLSVKSDSMTLETASVDGSRKYTLVFDFTSS